MDVTSRIEMLGKLQVKQAGRTITRFRTYKTGALLAYLAFYPDRAHAREQLIDLLWPDCEPAQGRNSLSQSLSSLRHQLEPPGVPAGAILQADRATIRLNPETFVTDVAEFEADIKRADGSDVSRLLSAVERYAGELLPGYYEDWVLLERERLREASLGALERLQSHWEAAGDTGRAIECARQAIEADPLREQAHASLIRLYVAAGQRASAVRHYQELERLLEKDLGVSPDPAVRALLKETGPPVAPAPAPPGPAPVAVERTAAAVMPAGVVTFLLADRPETDTYWEELAGRHCGWMVQADQKLTVAAFGRVTDAVETAIAAARAPHGGPAPRLALLTAEVGAEGPRLLPDRALLHAHRFVSAGHPGQILCAEGTAALLRRDLDPGLRVSDLGVYRLEGEESPERLFEIAYPGRETTFPAPNAQPGFAGNLPLQLTQFFGREAEIARIAEWVGGPGARNGSGSQPEGSALPAEGSRILTITGPGGTGKTRLGVELARRMTERFQGAVWFVPLADLTDPQLIPRAILDSLHLASPSQGDPMLQIAAALSRQPSLLVLDNVEQLLATQNDAQATAQIARALLECVPHLTCLVTSRRPLGLIGEQEFPLRPLPTPEAGDPASPEALSACESVQLFVDRAQIVRPDFQITGGNAASVATLCQRLEGIPLALELAAARCQVLTTAQILARLEKRLDFLVSRQPDRAPRHRTLRAAIDWSYDVLPEDAQRFFARLSVFRGGFTLEAAEEVCDEPLALDHLALLRECSLAQAEEDDGSGAIRFRLLETLREYAEERLGPEDRPEVDARHCGVYLALAEEADREMTGAGQAAALKRLDADHDNLRAALGRFLRLEDAERALRMVCALGTFWGIRGHIREARERFDAVLALPGPAQKTAAGARARDLAGTFALNQGDFAGARRLYEASLALYREIGDRQGVGDQLRSLGALAFEECDYPAARALWEECLAVFQELGNARSIAIVQRDLAYARSRLGEYDAAIPLFEESLRFFRPLGRYTGTAVVMIYYADALREKGDYAAARPLCEESLGIFREVGNQGGLAMALLTLADVLCERGDMQAADTYCDECLTIYQEMGDKDGIADTLYCQGKIARARGQARDAAARFEESLALHRELGSQAAADRCEAALKTLHPLA